MLRRVASSQHTIVIFNVIQFDFLIDLKIFINLSVFEYSFATRKIKSERL